jgi:hypothetical protein
VAPLVFVLLDRVVKRFDKLGGRRVVKRFDKRASRQTCAVSDVFRIRAGSVPLLFRMCAGYVPDLFRMRFTWTSFDGLKGRSQR